MAGYQFEVFTGRGSRGGSACGTRSGYSHGCRCDKCRAANTAYRRQAVVERSERLRAGDADVVHGRYTTYQNWGCRCPACTEANTAKCAEFVRRRRSLVVEPGHDGGASLSGVR